MAMLPVQINRLQRDIRELDYAIRRQEKRGNTIRVEELKTHKTYMLDALDELITIQ